MVPNGWKKAWGEYRLKLKKGPYFSVGGRNTHLFDYTSTVYSQAIMALRCSKGDRHLDRRISARSPLHVLRVERYVKMIKGSSKRQIYVKHEVPYIPDRVIFTDAVFSIPEAIKTAMGNRAYWGE